MAQPPQDLDTPRASKPQRRPRFDLEVPASPEAVLAAARAALAATPHVTGMVIEPGRLELYVPAEAARIWSPQLGVRVLPALSESGEPGPAPAASLLTCRFAPHPHVWGLYLAAYMASAVSAVGLAVLGVVQLVLDLFPWGLYAMPLAAGLAVVAYGASYFGQGLAAGQMYDLRRFLGTILERATGEAGLAGEGDVRPGGSPGA